MGLFVSTTGLDVNIPELGITITHPTTDFEVDAQFIDEEIKQATTLTTNIRSGDLVWKKTSGGSAETPTDYDPDYVEIE